MKVPDWFFQYLRKLPRDYTGKIELNFRNGGLTAADTRDHITEEIFHNRFQEHRKPGVPHESRDVAEPVAG